jgi:putative transposase
MNRIEEQWLHLKRQELGSYVFEDEYDLALAIIEGIENRGQQGNYPVERLMFNYSSFQLGRPKTDNLRK